MSLVRHFLVFIITPAIPHGAFKMKVAFCVNAVFTPVLAKRSESFSLVDCISVGDNRMQRTFEPMRRRLEAWRTSQLSDEAAKLIIYLSSLHCRRV
jgi:hypothetical protein